MPEDSEIYERAQAIKARLLQQEREFSERLAAVWAIVEAQLAPIYERLAQIMAEAVEASSTPISRVSLAKIEAAELAIAQTLMLADDAITQWQAMIEAKQREMVAQGEGDGNAMLDIAAIMAALAFLLPWAVRLDPRSSQDILDRVLTGSALVAVLTGRIGETVITAISEMASGVLAGKPLGDILTKVLRDLGAIGDTGILVGKSESGRTYRFTLEEIYKLTQAPLIGFRRVATRDTRTCLACLMDDGRIYKIGETMAEHPSGRCILVPVYKGQEGAAPWQTGKAWFQTLDPATQRQMLGPGRFEAWQAGKFTLDDLITVKRNTEYGDSLQPTPLKDLIA